MAPVEAENLPATHAVQSSEVNEPAAAKKVPAAQAAHAVAPVSAWYLPAAQLVQPLALPVVAE
jgi:hypothetical protein